MSSGIGLLIEYWKLGKAFNVTLSRQKKSSQSSDSIEGKAVTENSSSEVRFEILNFVDNVIIMSE